MSGISETEQYSYQQSVIRGKYYPHIDGLRAFAVLSVLIYHAFPALFPGGFIGVDVFFVISGYLITKGLLKDLDEKTYSIASFYVRRIRRIFPAYLSVVAFTLITGIVVYYGPELLTLAKTALCSSVFLANIYFERNSDYFSPNAHENPLLNLWSLSVEEQFYVFFPLLLAALHKWMPKHIKTIIWTIFLLSFIASIFLVNVKGSFTQAFYGLPTRAWELMGGCLLAIYFRDNFIRAKWNIFALICLCGAFLIFSSSLPFPGILAIIPVACAAILLISGQSSKVKPILENPITVFIGKISFSLYLFHWPLLVFCRCIASDLIPVVLVNSIAIGLSFLFSILSWKWIEIPVRKSRYANKTYFLFAISVIAFTIISSLLIKAWAKVQTSSPVVESGSYWQGEPAKSIYNKSIKMVTLGNDDNFKYCLWGDSHALATAPGFHDFSKKNGINGVYITSRATLHANTNYEGSFQLPHNADGIDQVLYFLQTRNDLKTVVLANRWACTMCGNWNETSGHWYPVRRDGEIGSHKELFEMGLRELCFQLKQMGKNVVIISSIPEQGRNIPAVLNRFAAITKKPYEVTSLPLHEYEQRQQDVEECFHKLESEGLVQIIWVKDFFYPNGFPRILHEKRSSLYLDDDHLSPKGATLLLNHISDKLKGLIIRSS